MTDKDHRTWFSFLERLASLSKEYSVEDLKWLKRESARRYPSAIPMIDACLTLAVSESQSTKDQPNNGKNRSTSPQADARKNSPMSAALLLDTKKFPSNSDLVDFGRSILPTFPQLRFDKMGRGRIVDTILAYMQKAPPEVQANFAGALLKTSVVNSEALANSEGERTSFLADWEKVIKGT